VENLKVGEYGQCIYIFICTGRWMRENEIRVNLTKLHCKHKEKYDNETLTYIYIYATYF
jgi:hypothetical protein